MTAAFGNEVLTPVPSWWGWRLAKNLLWAGVAIIMAATLAAFVAVVVVGTVVALVIIYAE